MTELAPQGKTTKQNAKDIAGRLIRHENAVLAIVLVALVAGIGILTKGLTLSRVNAVNIIIQSSMRGISAIGQAFVILTANIDLSVGGVGLFAAILGVTMMTRNMDWNIVGQSFSPLSIVPLMLLAGTCWGAFNGFSVSRVGIPALIATLAVWRICEGLAFKLSEGVTVGELPEAMSFFGEGSVGGVPVPVGIFVAVAVVAYFVLHHTVFGKSVYAVGGNPLTAWLSGINVRNILLAVFTISGFLAAVSGVIMTGRVMSASLRTLLGLELDTIAAVVIGGVSLAGGRGTLIGVVLGAIIIGVINNGLTVLGAGPAPQSIVKGAIIFAAVAIDYWRRGR